MTSGKKMKKIVVENHTEEVDNDTNNAEVISKELRVIAQEVKIVKSLASNDLNKRNRQLRKLRKWLLLRSRSSYPFAEENFLHIWKGLYYTMWMSDKPLVQEELAEQLAKLLECFDSDVSLSVNFFGAFLKTMCQEWFGLDQWRIDKFLMLMRRMLRYMFVVLKQSGWVKESVQRFNEHMLITVLAEEVSAIGLTMHFLDIFLEELAKVSDGSLNSEQVGTFMSPFVTFAAKQRNVTLVSHCRTRIFCHLLYQSALGREYSEKYNAWKEMGFPTKSIHDLEKNDDETISAEEEDETPEAQIKKIHLDPRAGNVDVFMPELPLDAKHIIKQLELFIYKSECSTKRRKMLKRLLALFKTYERGVFPLGVKRVPRFEQKSEQPLVKQKIKQLDNLENEMYSVGRKLKQLNKRKRRKLLKSLNFDNADEDNFEQVINKAIPMRAIIAHRKKLRAAMNNWVEEVLDPEDVNVENLKKQNGKSVDYEKPTQIKVIKRKNKKSSHPSEDEPAKKIKINESTVNAPAEELLNNAIPTPSKKIKKNESTAEPTPHKTLKSSSTTAITNSKPNITNGHSSAWNEPLADGEVEYFIPSRKVQVKQANSKLVRNPYAKLSAALPTLKNTRKPIASAALRLSHKISPKRVQIMLKNNTVQNPSEYLKQIRRSPNVPYDADKKPGKGLLKPNSMPSPINPFYKKKIGLRLLHDTM